MQPPTRPRAQNFLRAVLGDPNSRVDLERHLISIDSTLDSCEGPGPVDDHRRVRRGTRFEWVMPHTYRKTVATMLHRRGLSARTIADQLGDARVSMTQDVYMGRRAVDQAAAAVLEGISPSHDGDDQPPAVLSVVV